MSDGFSLREALLDFGTRLTDGVLTWAPRVIGGLVVVLLLLLAAKLVERMLRSFLTRVRLDELFDKIGVSASLGRVGIQQPMSRLLPRMTFYLLLFVFVQTGADSLGLTPISNGIGAFIAYLPNLVAAVLILLAGSLGGQFAGQAVGNAAKSSGIEFASALGNLVSALILLVAGIMAVGQLKIDTEIIRVVSFCTLAGLALAFGLSFGLGTREITRNIIAGFYARKVFNIGDELEIRGERGQLTAITPTQVLLERDGRTIAISNGVFLDEVVRQ